MNSGVVGKRGVCACAGVKDRGVMWGGGVLLHMCVFGELVLTQTQPPHCPPPSPVRMFEGRLIAWLPLISAGTENHVPGNPCPSRTRDERGAGHGV